MPSHLNTTPVSIRQGVSVSVASVSVSLGCACVRARASSIAAPIHTAPKPGGRTRCSSASVDDLGGRWRTETCFFLVARYGDEFPQRAAHREASRSSDLGACTLAGNDTKLGSQVRPELASVPPPRCNGSPGATCASPGLGIIRQCCHFWGTFCGSCTRHVCSHGARSGATTPCRKRGSRRRRPALARSRNLLWGGPTAAAADVAAALPRQQRARARLRLLLLQCAVKHAPPLFSRAPWHAPCPASLRLQVQPGEPCTQILRAFHPSLLSLVLATCALCAA